jgi:hypothetical protein
MAWYVRWSAENVDMDKALHEAGGGNAFQRLPPDV